MLLPIGKEKREGWRRVKCHHHFSTRERVYGELGQPQGGAREERYIFPGGSERETSEGRGPDEGEMKDNHRNAICNRSLRPRGDREEGAALGTVAMQCNETPSPIGKIVPNSVGRGWQERKTV